MNLLLVGRDTSVTNTIRDMLSSEEAWSVTKINSVNKSAVDSPEEGLYDIIVANLTDFPPPPTLVITKITSYFPSSELLVLYSYDQESLVEPLLQAGADGYLQNGSSDDKLIEAVQTLMNGEQYIGVESTY